MASYAYKARKRSGELVTGVLEVTDRSAALSQIERLGLFPVKIELSRSKIKKKVVKRKTIDPSQKSSSLLPQFLQDIIKRQRRPKLKELATYTTQLANLLRSGMPLTLALNSMTHLEAKGVPPSISNQLKQDVMEGKNLSDAMARHSVYFSDIYVNMVRAGEQSGALQEVLRRLASHYERFSEVQQKFTSSLIYPAVVAAVGAVIMFVFMTFMLPKFLSIFDGLQVPLPASTRALIGVSHFMGHYWWLILGVAIVIFILFKRFQTTEHGKRRIDEFKLKAPILGKIIRLNLFSQFARTLSTLLINGVPVLEALKITQDIIPNCIIKDAIGQTRNEVTDGKTIAEPLARSKIFPQLMIDLLKIGEETGDVPGALENLADTYENELAIALRVMTNLIEPIMIIVMAVGVGLLLLSVLSAMFAITSNISV